MVKVQESVSPLSVMLRHNVGKAVMYSTYLRRSRRLLKCGENEGIVNCTFVRDL